MRLGVEMLVDRGFGASISDPLGAIQNSDASTAWNPLVFGTI